MTGGLACSAMIYQHGTSWTLHYESRGVLHGLAALEAGVDDFMVEALENTETDFERELPLIEIN